jgi:pyruvate/2-oxoglutarate dehydrogenase complex dihydrolipoamide acyltransferase (E2) component
MGIAYTMPKLAMAMNEGTINEWLVQHGARVQKGQQIMNVETEKVSYECESPEEGFLCIVVPEGETVPCDTTIAHFCASEEEVNNLLGENDSSAPSPETDAQTSESTVDESADASATRTPLESVVDKGYEAGRVKSSPVARKLARENNLDITRIEGTGPGGRIIKCDVLAAVENRIEPSQATSASPLAVPPTEGTNVKARIPIKGMRKTIADRMQQSLQTTAQLSSNWESDVTDLLALRQRFVQRQEQLGTKVSVNAFLIKAICCAIKQVPIANACREGDEVVIYDSVNMGIAIAVPGTTEFDSGLMVAVLHGVERMGVAEIDLEMKALIGRVRNGEARPEDLSGSTITMSSTAGIAPPGMTATPVLNLPNVGLVGPSTPQQKPVIYNGEMVARNMLPMSFTFDHSAMDGEPAARFMSALHEVLETPELMLV